MPILDIQEQARMRELGRIRLGEQVAVKGRSGVRRPARLETFRLTAKTQRPLDAAAAVYGGTVSAWPEEDGYQLTTDTAELSIVVPPGAFISQWNELWTGGGCVRRCDSVTNVIDQTPCACPADPAVRAELAQKGQACKPTTRLSVMLPDLPDMGVWRVESHGFYAAVELAPAAGILQQAMQAGVYVPAMLGIEARTVKRPGQQPKHFVVPIISLPNRLTDYPALMGAAVAISQNIAAGRPAIARIGPPPLGQERPALPASTQMATPAADGQADPDDDPIDGPTPMIAAIADAVDPTARPELPEGGPIAPVVVDVHSGNPEGDRVILAIDPGHPAGDRSVEVPVPVRRPNADPTAAPTCRWRLERRGGGLDPCTFADLHRGDHSFQDAAVREGGRLVPPSR